MNLKHLFPYLKERFSPVNMALFTILFFTVMSASLYFAGQPFSFTWQEGLGIVATISFFFRLRVFDEIKDYELDLVLHPDRVLQSGKISLRDLKILAALLSLSEIAWSWLMGTTTLICFAIVVAYSLLMRYEFFVSEFLKKRLVLYAFSHMLIMPLVILWLWTAWQPNFDLTQPLLVLMALSVLGGFSFELARKIHAPQAEREGLDSYSKALGYQGAIFAVLTVLLIGIGTQAHLLEQIGSRWWPYVLIGIIYALAVLIYLGAIKKPEQKKVRKAELVVSLFMLISYLSIIIEIAAS